MLRKTILVLAIATALAACSKGGKEPAKGADGKAAKEKPAELIVATEDLITVAPNALASGPVITGSVQPERKADLRAEVSAVVLQVLKENGEVVRRGDVLVKLDETAIRDSLASAEQSARSAGQALDQSSRTLERLKTLRASGMVSLQALDDAEVRRNTAQSEVSASRTRAVLARQQLARTSVRAPFDGVVSERKVSAGDTAAVGKELLKVIDATSMRFEGRVAADQIAAVKVGQAVSFRVNGYQNQEFRGAVKRIDPAANAVTRQVEVTVGFADATRPSVSGLFAEGRIEAASVATLMLPEGALVKVGDKTYAWRMKGDKLQKVELGMGVRDTRTGNFEIRSGLAAGDLIMRSASSKFSDGQKATMAPSKIVNAAAVAAAPAVVKGK
ncbi:MAG: efflux RND transporter periplasmic adaptor subunit [Pseudomonadota bacterium]